jgi:hypothetical protein
MRDPDLVVRAQRAAEVLERAWDRWRTLHGMDAEPPPPVSSYVGYSQEEPMGQPRVVFGVAAEEAELLASLLERHECTGPAAARQEASPAVRPAEDPAARMPRPAAGSRRQIPAQGLADPPERLRAAGPGAGYARPAELPRDGTNGHGTLGHWADDVTGSGSGSRANGATGDGTGNWLNGTNGHVPGSQNLAGPMERPASAVRAVSPLRSVLPVMLGPATPPAQAEEDQPGWAALSGYAPPSVHAAAAPASVAAPGMADQDWQASQAPDAPDRNGAALLAAERPRGHRHPGEHAMPHSARQRRASAAAAERDAVPPVKPAAAPQAAGHRRDGKEHRGLSTMAGDLAGWASGELPGQARRQPGAAGSDRAPGP